MTRSFEIITDSSCNLSEHMIDELGLHILPLTFMVEGEEKIYQSYLKGQHTDLTQFYDMMRNGKVFKTSLPNLADSEELMRGLLEEGKDILYLGFSSGLSGTYEATELLIKQLATEFPQQKVYALDTLCASCGQGLLIWNAVQYASKGASIEETREWVEQNKMSIATWLSVDDLKYLVRGGRVSKTSAVAGTMLSIKPIIHVDDEGKLNSVDKIRGRKKALNALVDQMKNDATAPLSEQVVFLAHSDCKSDAAYVESQIKERFGVAQVITVTIDPVIGAHTGPGTVVIAFVAERR